MKRPEQATVEWFADQWAAWMIEMSIQALVLAAAVALLAWMFRHRSASFRYALWLVVLVRLVIPPHLALPTGWGWWLREEVATSSFALTHVGAWSAPSAPLAASRSLRADTKPVHRAAGRDSSHVAPTAPIMPSRPRDAATADASSAAPGTPDSSGPSWAALFMLGWAGVSFTLLAYLAAGAVRTRQWVRQASTELDPRVRRLLGRCRWRLEVTQNVELRNSQDCTTPLVVGWWRPVILIPTRVLSDLDDDELEAVLLHELNHIVRRDALVNLAQAVLGSVYFFHPVAWWTNREVRRLREDACDEMTVAALEGRRRAYGSALVKVAEILGYAAPPLALGVKESSHSAKRRLGRILDPRLPLRDRWSWLSLALVTLLAMVFLPGAPRLVLTDAVDEVIPIVASEHEPIAKSQANDEASRAPIIRAKHQEEAPRLRYRWTPGQSLGYSVQVEAHDDRGIETRHGHVHYAVREVDDGRAMLAVHGSTHGVRRPHPGAAPSFGPPQMEFFAPFDHGGARGFWEERTLTVNTQGGIESVRGGTPLPFGLGDLARLPLLPIPLDSARTWTKSSPVTIEWIERNERFPRSPFMQPAPERMEAHESNHFRITTWNDAEATIKRRVELTTIQRIEEKPRLAISGEGEAIFDRQAGNFRSLQWRLTLTSQEAYVARVTKISVTCQRQESTTGAGDQPGEVDLDRLIADLDSSEKDRVFAAMRALQHAEPGDDQQVVASRLARFLDATDNALRDAGAQAFAHWAGTDDCATLLQVIDDPSVPVRWAALDALGRLCEPTTAVRMAARLEVGMDRVVASRALTQLGPAAEEAVLPFILHDDSAVRLAAINILREVGGPLSLTPLQAAVDNDPESHVRRWAKLAAEAVEKRSAPEGP